MVQILQSLTSLSLFSLSVHPSLAHSSRSFLNLFIKISYFPVSIIPCKNLFSLFQEVKIQECKISCTHCCMNKKKEREAPFP